jgi:predicted kinase
MFARLSEAILPGIIGIMVHKRETLTAKEQQAQKAFLESLEIASGKTKKPVVVAMIGLVGSGKSTVAKELAKYLPATVIEGDAIRVFLRKEGEKYEGMRKIAENVMAYVIQNGGNVILDSDYIDAKKRASLRKKAEQFGARVYFIRVHTNWDMMIGYALAADYHDTSDDFFGGASSPYQGDAKTKGAIVKTREMWRRTPHHYKWHNTGGGRWTLKNLPFPVIATIDMSTKWKDDVQKVAKKLHYLK